MGGIEFSTELVKERNVVRLWIPEQVTAVLGTARLIPAVVSINEHPIRTTLHKMRGGYMVAVNKAVQEQVGVTGGDTVRVTVELDHSERTLDLPDDLVSALTESGTRTAFDRLSAFRQAELLKSVTSAKRADTRVRRIEQVVSLLRVAPEV